MSDDSDVHVFHTNLGADFLADIVDLLAVDDELLQTHHLGQVLVGVNSTQNQRFGLADDVSQPVDYADREEFAGFELILIGAVLIPLGTISGVLTVLLGELVLVSDDGLVLKNIANGTNGHHLSSSHLDTNLHSLLHCFSGIKHNP